MLEHDFNINGDIYLFIDWLMKLYDCCLLFGQVHVFCWLNSVRDKPYWPVLCQFNHASLFNLIFFTVETSF